jgi:hypothetical protein
MRRTAALADGWYPIGSNPRFPMSTPAQLASQRLCYSVLSQAAV